MGPQRYHQELARLYRGRFSTIFSIKTLRNGTQGEPERCPIKTLQHGVPKALDEFKGFTMDDGNGEVHAEIALPVHQFVTITAQAEIRRIRCARYKLVRFAHNWNDGILE